MINELLNDHKINEIEVFNLLSSMADNGSDYSDLFFNTLSLSHGFLTKELSKMVHIILLMVLEQDAYLGDQTGFSYSDDLNLKAIKGAVDFAKGISNDKSTKAPEILKSARYPSKYAAISPLDSLSSKQKVDLYSDRLILWQEKSLRLFKSTRLSRVLIPKF